MTDLAPSGIVDRRAYEFPGGRNAWFWVDRGLRLSLRKSWGFVRNSIQCALLLYTTGAQATEACTWESAAAYYGVNAKVLYAIARQESSLNPGAINKNLDGSHDFGLMQINSRWLPHLKKFGITSAHLLDPCINLHIGAYILALSVARHGNSWQAIGAYHSNTPARRDFYAQSIYLRLKSLGLIPPTQHTD